MLGRALPILFGAGLTVSLLLPCLAQDGNTIPESFYRAGQRPVLTPEKTEPEASSLDGAAIRSRFERAYRAAKRPRIAVYWDRTFSDQVSDWFVPVRVRETLSGEGNARWSDGVRVEGEFSGNRTKQLEMRRMPKSRPALPERPLAEFENAFYHEFLDAGARLVDRSAIIRLMRNDLKGALVRENVPDVQVLETEALKDYADLLMELIFIGHPKAKFKAAVRVTVKRVLTGQVIASHYAYLKEDEKAEKAKGELTAGPGGFYRKPPAPEVAEPAAFAKRLALETMDGLKNRLKL